MHRVPYLFKNRTRSRGAHTPIPTTKTSESRVESHIDSQIVHLTIEPQMMFENCIHVYYRIRSCVRSLLNYRYCNCIDQSEHWSTLLIDTQYLANGNINMMEQITILVCTRTTLQRALCYRSFVFRGAHSPTFRGAKHAIQAIHSYNPIRLQTMCSYDSMCFHNPICLKILSEQSSSDATCLPMPRLYPLVAATHNTHDESSNAL